MKHIYIRSITVICILFVFTLQCIWLKNSFDLLKNQFEKTVKELFEEASFKEATLHFSELPEGIDFLGAPRTENEEVFPEATYLLESLGKYGIACNISKLDSVYRETLLQHNINTYFYIDRMKYGSIIETTKRKDIRHFGIIKTQLNPIKLDGSLKIQATLVNPYSTIFKQMGLLIIATAIMMVIIIGCIIYQLRIISRMNKISRIREDFSYALIHDMKNPLSTIFTTLNFLHTGRLDDKPEKREKYFRIAEGEVDHLLTLTNKVLTVSKLEQHKLDMQKEKIELPPMIDKLVDKFTAKADKPIRFIKDLQATEVYADAEYLEEVLDNLIDNAVKYSKENVEITLSSSCNGRHTFLRVHDNGIGISDKDQKVIFNKYERGAAGRRKRKQGASGFGLGLNFVQQVVEAHGGNIFVNSIEGKFTEFVISLPLQDLN